MQILTLAIIEERCEKCGDCWEYRTDAKSLHNRKHPQVKHEGRHWLARRLAYEFAKGPVKDGRRLVPVCDNEFCINPKHMQAMTESEKCLRAAQRGSFSSPTRGAKIAQARRETLAKITHEEALEIRLSDESGPVLAAKYGIAKSRVNAIKRGDAWKDYRSPFAGLAA